MSLQPAPRAQITSWPTGSVALLKHNSHIHMILQHIIVDNDCVTELETKKGTVLLPVLSSGQSWYYS